MGNTLSIVVINVLSPSSMENTNNFIRTGLELRVPRGRALPIPLRPVQFEGLPINAVWTWSPSFSTVQFIQDPNELLSETPDFRVFYPTDQPRSVLNNLVALQAGRPYLIEASTAATWTVKGRPALLDRSFALAFRRAHGGYRVMDHGTGILPVDHGRDAHASL